MLQNAGVLCILTWTYASRHNGLHFSDFRTSKNGARLLAFVFRGSGMPFFNVRNLEKWSEDSVIHTFWIGNARRATAACNFSFLWPHRSAPAALASLLFDPDPQILEKHNVSPFRDFPNISGTRIFFLLTLSLSLYSSLLCFSSRKLGSPSPKLRLMTCPWFGTFVLFLGCLMIPHQLCHRPACSKLANGATLRTNRDTLRVRHNWRRSGFSSSIISFLQTP